MLLIGRGVVAASVVLTAALVRAQDAPQRRVELHLEDCLGADAAAVRRIAAAELGDVLVGFAEEAAAAGGEVASEPDAQTIDALIVHADCGVESAVVVASHERTAVRLERRVELVDAAPNARTRLLALSITELAASAWAAVDAAPPPVVDEPARVAEELSPPPRLLRDRIHRTEAPPPPPPEPPERPFGIRAIAAVRVSGTPVHVSGGGGLGVEIGLPSMLGVGADFRYEQGQVGVGPLGGATLRVAWGSLLALVRPVVGWSSITIGGGAKLGVAWIEGNPAAADVMPATQAGFVIGPAITASGAFHLAGAGFFHIGVELAWITLGVMGTNGVTGEELASFGGPQITITAGFEIQPPL